MNSSFIVALFVIGNIVGSGFFMLPSKLAPIGINLIYSWAIAGTMAIIFAMMFGRLYILFPKSSVLSDYFDNRIFKRVVAMVYWIGCIIGNTGLLVVIVASLNIKYSVLAGGLIMTLLTITNGAVRYSVVARVEALLTVLKFTILAGLPICLFMIDPNMFSVPGSTGTGSDIVATGISCMWAFLGIETAAIFGSGVHAKRGLLIGVITCTILYVASSLFIVGVVPAEELANSTMPFSLLITKFFGASAEKYIAFLIAFTAFGALYGWVAATSKMSLIYAKTDVFPKAFLKKAQSDTSYLGLWLSSIASTVLFIAVNHMHIKSQFDFVADLCVYVTLAIYAFCAYMLLRSTKALLDQFIALSSIVCVLASFMFNLEMTLFTIATFIVTTAYVAYSCKRRTAAE